MILSTEKRSGCRATSRHPSVHQIPILNLNSAKTQLKDLYNLFKRLNTARRAATLSHPPFLTTLMRSHQLNNHSIAFSKPPLLSLLSNYGSAEPATGIHLTPQQTGYRPLLPVIDVLSSQIFATDHQGGLTVPIVRGEPRVFLPLTVHGGAVAKEGWASTVREETRGRAATPSDTHRKRSSLGSVISWLGVRGMSTSSSSTSG